MKKHTLRVRLENWLRAKTNFFCCRKEPLNWRMLETWEQVSIELHARREQLREELLTVMELCEHAAIGRREAKFLDAKNKAAALPQFAEEMQLRADAEQDWCAELSRQIVEKSVALREKAAALNTRVQALTPEIAGWEKAYAEWTDD